MSTKPTIKRRGAARVRGKQRTRRRAAPRRREATAARLKRELNEALQQQAATAEVLQIIASSPGEPQPVFDAILKHARRICDAEFGNIYRWDGEALHIVAWHNTPAAFAAYRADSVPPRSNQPDRPHDQDPDGRPCRRCCGE